MDVNEVIKKYDNDEITVVWRPALCIHSKRCWQATGLPEVFNPRERPWVNINGSTTNRIIEQVDKCPSRALTYFYTNSDQPISEVPTVQTSVEILQNGPLMIYGSIMLKDQHGNETIREKATAFCRCSLSASKPYCDGSHKAVKFDK